MGYNFSNLKVGVPEVPFLYAKKSDLINLSSLLLGSEEIREP